MWCRIQLAISPARQERMTWCCVQLPSMFKSHMIVVENH